MSVTIYVFFLWVSEYSSLEELFRILSLLWKPPPLSSVMSDWAGVLSRSIFLTFQTAVTLHLCFPSGPKLKAQNQAMWLWVSTYITCHMHRKRRQCIEEFKGISQWSHFHLVWGRQKHMWYVFIYKNIYAGLNYIKIIFIRIYFNLFQGFRFTAWGNSRSFLSVPGKEKYFPCSTRPSNSPSKNGENTSAGHHYITFFVRECFFRGSHKARCFP